MKLFHSILIIAFCSISAYSQNLFPEKFDGCITDHFKLEKDTASVRQENTEIAKVLEKAVGSNNRSKIRGVLLLQIIVDTNGNSCLISIKNDTNISTGKMKLKEVIDAELIWEKPKEKLSPIISVKFNGDTVYITRLGLGGDKGMHELKP